MKNIDPLILYIYHSVFGEGFLVFIFCLKEMFVIIKYIHKICVISYLHLKKKKIKPIFLSFWEILFITLSFSQCLS